MKQFIEHVESLFILNFTIKDFMVIYFQIIFMDDEFVIYYTEESLKTIKAMVNALCDQNVQLCFGRSLCWINLSKKTLL